VAQVLGPEFKPQYGKKTKTKNSCKHISNTVYAMMPWRDKVIFMKVVLSRWCREGEKVLLGICKLRPAE
jgi:hypothetical protein